MKTGDAGRAEEQQGKAYDFPFMKSIVLCDTKKQKKKKILTGLAHGNVNPDMSHIITFILAPSFS